MNGINNINFFNIYQRNGNQNNNSQTLLQRRGETDSFELTQTKKDVKSNKAADIIKNLGNKIQNFGKSFFTKNLSTVETNYLSVYEGFEEHFFSAQDSIIKDITLTDEQKEILTN